MINEVIALPVTFAGPLGSMVLNLSVIVGEEGVTLVDASMTTNEDGVVAALEERGFAISDVRQIILTHQDIDHIGGLAELKRRSGAEAWAHAIEAPYIEGRERLIKYPSEERLTQNPGMRPIVEQIGYASIERELADGELLDIAGGVRVIWTPGHTPGHICLFHELTKTLITGDAMTSSEGKLSGPNPGPTPDMPGAIESVKKLVGLGEIDRIITYHGGVVTDDPRGQLLRVIAELTAA